MSDEFDYAADSVPPAGFYASASPQVDTDTCLLRGPPPRTPTNSVSSWFRFGFPPWVTSAHRGTGVRRRCRAPHPPARAPLAHARLDGTLGVTGGGMSAARWVGVCAVGGAVGQ